MSATGRPGVLFLCVANSARSQLAHAIARAEAAPAVEVFSAGSAPTRVNPLARQALREAGVDDSNLRSQGVGEIPMERVRAVVTLCADEVCPVLAAKVDRHHWPLDDPSSLEDFRALVVTLRPKIQALLASM